MTGQRSVECVVIGSGPSGIACAKALLERGAAVTIVDIGVQLEDNIRRQVQAVASQDPSIWTESQIDSLKAPLEFTGRSEAPLKTVFRSSYPYQPPDPNQIQQTDTRCVVSQAKGGLSTVWGGHVMRYAHSDIKHWPVSLQDLDAGYAAAAQIIKPTRPKDNDSLDDLFPSPYSYTHDHNLSRQGETLLRKAKQNVELLKKHGVVVGKSRLALSGGCKEVGLCLSGCPFFSIFQADRWLEEAIQGENKLQYLGGREVVKIHGNKLSGVMRETGKPFELTAQKFFLAAGVLGTARIVFESLDLQELELPLAYHPYALTPLLFLKNEVEAPRERRHTLAQLFMEVWLPAVSQYPVHNQVSTYNAHIKDAVEALLKRFGLQALRPWFSKFLLGRLGAVQSYLHSNEGGMITIQFHKYLEGTLLKLAPPISSAVHQKFSTYFRQTLWQFLRLGALPLTFMSKIGKPGTGNHIGSCFPMAHQPGEFQTDGMGQLRQLPTLHIVDASVLPDLPAQTITFTIMANAYRIGSKCALKLAPETKT